MRKSASKGAEKIKHDQREIEWELRPGGMLVQKREVGVDPSGPMINIKVSHDSCHYDIGVPAQSTFGELKKVLVLDTGLEPKEQRLLFRGKEKEDHEYLHMAGVTETSKVILLEDPASKERKLEEMKRYQGVTEAYEAISQVKAEVDRLSEKVVALQTAVCNGTNVADKEFLVLTELLMMQLLKLDSIEADGEAKMQRRMEVRRVQSFVDTLDSLKARTSNPFSNSCNAVSSVTTKWETFESGFGSLNPPIQVKSATKVTENWELF